VALVGGKNSSLGEMIQNLAPKGNWGLDRLAGHRGIDLFPGVRVPSGFATTAHAYRTFIEKAGLEPQLRELFKDLDVNNTSKLASVGAKARSLIINSPFPEDLNSSIIEVRIRAGLG